MLRLDAHQHFWNYDPVRDTWMTPEMGAIKRDFGPNDLYTLLEEQAMDGSIAVQASSTAEETAFLLDCARSHPFIRGVVGWVDLLSDDLQDQLSHYTGFPFLKGFRHVLQWEKQRDFMLTPSFQRGIGMLNRYGFTYDILVFPDQLGFARTLAEAFPDQPFVLDHLGKPAIAQGVLEPWASDIRALAACPNVWCKVSGMVTEASWTSWKASDFRPYLDTVLDAFGAKRLMFGSDWPVCLVAGTYQDTTRVVNDYFSSFSQEERHGIFGGNAATFYHITQ